MSLFLIGEGEVNILNDKNIFTREKSSDVLSFLNWEPIRLKSKEGLKLC